MSVTQLGGIAGAMVKKIRTDSPLRVIKLSGCITINQLQTTSQIPGIGKTEGTEYPTRYEEVQSAQSHDRFNGCGASKSTVYNQQMNRNMNRVQRSVCLLEIL